MTTSGFDPEIMQDFLTECGELLGQLESDLVALEDTPENLDLINQVFRALHTIKGSASFLALTNLVSIAHAAESALNAARNSLVVVDRAMMDLLLRAVDTIRRQLSELAAGDELSAPDAAVVRTLSEIGEGRNAKAPTAAAAPAPAPSRPNARALQLPAGKADLVEYLIADVDDTLTRVRGAAETLNDAAARTESARTLAEQAEALAKALDFFDLSGACRLARAVAQVGEHLTALDPDALAQTLPRVQAVLVVLQEHAKALHRREVLDLNTDALAAHVQALAAGEGVDSAAQLPDRADAGAVLRAYAIRLDAETPASADAQPASTEAAPEGVGAETRPDEATKRAAAVDQTIRVDVGRLEALMNLVGELVLQKNRINSLSRQLQGSQATQSLRESVSLTAAGLDRVTSDIQLAVMRTRMQPLEKLFGRYPRLIRDLAHKTGKQIDLVIEGGDTEVDKSVLEELGDPLVHLMRNSADHGIEMPADRRAAGKPETGTIKLVASHEGNSVRVSVMDDGRGLQRDRIARKAVERGLVSESELANLSDPDIYRFIFLPGFSTAEQVSDLSGRGVGMDVVRTNIERLKGAIDLASTPGRGSSVTISIPLTVAILPAMMVGVGAEIYAIPLSHILEIVRPPAEQVCTIGEQPVMRLRNAVLPLVSAADIFELKRAIPGTSEGASIEAPFAVVLSSGGKQIGLMVSHLIGQQEIVIKPLDGLGKQERGASGPISGATVRDDGGVSLIIDVAQLIRMAERQRRKAA